MPPRLSVQAKVIYLIDGLLTGSHDFADEVRKQIIWLKNAFPGAYIRGGTEAKNLWDLVPQMRSSIEVRQYLFDHATPQELQLLGVTTDDGSRLVWSEYGFKWEEETFRVAEKLCKKFLRLTDASEREIASTILLDLVRDIDIEVYMPQLDGTPPRRSLKYSATFDAERGKVIIEIGTSVIREEIKGDGFWDLIDKAQQNFIRSDSRKSMIDEVRGRQEIFNAKSAVGGNLKQRRRFETLRDKRRKTKGKLSPQDEQEYQELYKIMDAKKILKANPGRLDSKWLRDENLELLRLRDEHKTITLRVLDLFKQQRLAIWLKRVEGVAIPDKAIGVKGYAMGSGADHLGGFRLLVKDYVPKKLHKDAYFLHLVDMDVAKLKRRLKEIS
jgi:hypothetical protein